MVVSNFQYLITIVIFVSIIVIVPLFILVIWLVIKKKYKHTIVITEVFGNSKRTIVKSCCDYIDKLSQAKHWKLLNEKDPLKRIAPLPPNDMLGLTLKGKNVAYAIRTETGDYVYYDPKLKLNIKAIPTNLYEDMPDAISQIQDDTKRNYEIEKWKKKKKEEWLRTNNIDLEIKPFTPNQRLIQMMNFKKADERRNKEWTQHLPLLIGGGILLLAFVAIIMWIMMVGDIAQPILDSQAAKTNQMMIQKETLEIIREIQTDTKTIRAYDGISQNQNPENKGEIPN